MTQPEQLEKAIAHLQTQRALLGDAAVDAAVAALRRQIAASTPSPHPEPRRRQVTILFADVSGFTTLSESMDAEDLSALMNALWQRLDASILHHGGTVDKHMGDGLMALWGALGTREHDPERAIRAALDMQAGLAAFCADRGLDLSLRVGIHTGPVLLAQVSTTGEFTAMGDAVNTAHRLEQHAPAAGALISHDTYRHVRGLFDVRAPAPIHVKGKSEPVPVYAVLRARPRAFRVESRGVEGIETRMIGRATELGLLQAAFHAVMRASPHPIAGGPHVSCRSRVIVVTGEAGVGKSRLLYEFENWCDLEPHPFFLLKARAAAETQHRPYALLRDLLASHFDIHEGEAPASIVAKIETGLATAHHQAAAGTAVAGLTAQARTIGHLLGFDVAHEPLDLHTQPSTARQLRDTGVFYIVQALCALAARRPLLLILEDLHWADDSSLEAIGRLIAAGSGLPFLFIALARPAFFERRQYWVAGAGVTYLPLSPLSTADSLSLVREILQKADDVPAALAQLVVERAEGNPFYVEELIKMLVEDGAIVKGEPRWTVQPGRLSAGRVPPTLTGVLQARLDALPPPERALLQQASVVGRTFWDDALLSVHATGAELPTAGSDQVRGLLHTLSTRGLISRQAASSLSPATEYRFAHALLHDVAYETVLREQRPRYHASVAAWLIEHSGARAAQHAGLIAHHLARSNQSAGAAAWYRRAGEQAAARFAHEEALHYFGRALALTGSADLAARFDLHAGCEWIYRLRGERERQQAVLADMHALAETLDDAPRRAEIALRQSAYLYDTGDFSAAADRALAAVDLASSVPAGAAPALQARAWLHLASPCLRAGDYARAEQALDRAIPLARAAAEPLLEANALSKLGTLCYYQAQFDRARQGYEQSLAIHRRLGSLDGESAELGNLGLVAYEQADYEQAQACVEQALALKRQTGDRGGEGWLVNILGMLAFDTGRYARARGFYAEAAAIAQEVGDRWGESNAVSNLGIVCCTLGEHQAAARCFDEALRIKQDIGDRRGTALTLAFQSLLCHHLGRDAQALALSGEALASGVTLQDPEIEGYAALYQAHALAALDRLPEARQAYARSQTARRAAGHPALLAESAAGLAHVALKLGDLPAAREHVDAILPLIGTAALAGAVEPVRVVLTCGTVLHALGDPAAGRVLAAAHQLLEAQAAHIPNQDRRRTFLTSCAAHRAVVEASQAAGTQSEG